jgi:excisionase family DNA binding protein
LGAAIACDRRPTFTRYHAFPRVDPELRVGAMNKNEELEPLAVTIEQTCHLTNECKTTIYELIAAGQYEAIKSGRKTLIVYASIKKRFANLPKLELTRKRRKA